MPINSRSGGSLVGAGCCCIWERYRPSAWAWELCWGQWIPTITPCFSRARTEYDWSFVTKAIALRTITAWWREY